MRVLIWLCGLGALCGCGPVKAPAEPQSLPPLVTEQAHLAHLAQMAKLGDAHAAATLAQHYDARGQPGLAYPWWRGAAALGHAAAQYHLWLTLRQSGHCADLQAGLSWLERAAAQQYPEAVAELATAQRRLKSCSHKSGKLPPNNSSKPTPLRGAA
jgi:hypothetical protein